MEYLDEALFIAGVGISVVLTALLVLAGIIWGLTRLLPDRGGKPQGPNSLGPEPHPNPPGGATGDDHRTRIAAAAVAVALARLGGGDRIASRERGPRLSRWRLQGLEEMMGAPRVTQQRRWRPGQPGHRKEPA